MKRSGGADRITIEPFDPEKHDRSRYSCGIEQVDNFLKKSANKLSKADNLRIFAMVDSSPTLIGFYAISAHGVDYRDLPPRFARARPRNGNIPAAFIAMIGVDSRFQGKGYGGDLLIDCLGRIADVADNLGIAVIMLDVLDCGNPSLVAKRKRLYDSYGFTPLPSDPLRLFLPLATVRTLFQD